MHVGYLYNLWELWLVACIPNAYKLVFNICNSGCFLSDLTPTDAARKCADRGFVNTVSISSGVVCYNRTTTGSEAVYICDDGFHQDGAATRVCQSGGVWNGSIPQCLPDQDGQVSSVPVNCHQGTIKPRLNLTISKTLLYVVGSYRIAGNFHEAEIFTIKPQLAKICSCENFFLQKFLADKLRMPNTVCSSRRSSESTKNCPRTT